jgi:CHAD domain-containing protein
MKGRFECEAKTLADWAYVAIDKHFHKVLKYEAGVLQDEDPEELHQMRVGMRRLRSALTGFAPALELPKFARQKPVGKIARTLGELRDLDVLKESLLSNYKPRLPEKEQIFLQEALKALESQREKRFEETYSLFQASIYQSFKQAFQDWLEKPNYQPIGSLAIATVLPDLLLPQASHLLLHEGWLIGIDWEENKSSDRRPVEAIDFRLEQQGKILHDLRKEAKRSRYNMELFIDFYGKKYRKHLEDIKSIQENLGEIQDCQLVADFLTKIFGKSLALEMPTLQETFQTIRYQKWQEWQPRQRKFLAANTRKSLHEAILNPVFEENEVESKD